jgi:hypothetical protein
MMCLGDRSTFASTGTLSGRRDGSSPLFLEDLLSSRGVCVCKSSSYLPPQSFHGIRAWYRLRAEQQAKEAKEAVQQQEVIISSPFVFTTTPMSELFGKHRQTTSD